MVSSTTLYLMIVAWQRCHLTWVNAKETADKLDEQKHDKRRQKWKTSLVHAVSARFFKKVGARLLETRQHIVKMWISNVFSLSIIKAINLNWIIPLISCFCLFYQKMLSQTRSKGTVKPKKIKLYFKSKNKGGFFQSKNETWKQKTQRWNARVLFLALTHGPGPLGKWFEHGFALSLQSRRV